MGNALQGRKILVTRPQDQAEQICALIEAQGGEAIRLPVQVIKPVEVTAALREIISNLERYQVAIFISRNAVHYAFELLQKDITLLAHMTIMAVGTGTATMLQAGGIPQVLHAGTTGGSEALLQLPDLQADRVHGLRLIIFCGGGGREHLLTELQARGAQPEYAVVYQRIPAHYSDSVLEQLWCRKKPEVIVGSSNEGLQALVDMQSPEHRVMMQNTDLIVLSKRAVELALTLGFTRTPVLAEATNDAGLLDAILRWAGQNDRVKTDD